MKTMIQRLLPTFGGSRARATRTLTAAIALLVIGALLGVNLLIGSLPFSSVSLPISGEETFLLSGKTQDWLDGLDEEVELYLVSRGGVRNADGDLYGFLQEYAAASPHVSLSVVDPAANGELIAAFGGTWPSDQSILVRSAARARIVDYSRLFYYYNSEIGVSLTAGEYQYMLSLMTGAGDSAALERFLSATTAYFAGESEVTGAMRYVTADDVRTAGVISVDGNSSVPHELLNELQMNDFLLCAVESLAAIPEACDLLILHELETDLTEEEAASLSAYLQAGGDLVLTTVATTVSNMTRLGAVLRDYGLSAPSEAQIVCEGKTASIPDSASPYFFFAQVSDYGLDAPFDGLLLNMVAHPILLSDVEGVVTRPLLSTSESGYLIRQNADTSKTEIIEESTVHVCGAVAERGDSTVIWLGSPDTLSPTANDYSAGGNYEWFLTRLRSVEQIEGELRQIDGKPLPVDRLEMNGTRLLLWGAVLVAVLPLGVLIGGATVCQRRRKR